MKTILTAITLLMAFCLQAQKFEGKATYKTFRKSNFTMKGENGAQDDKIQEEIRARLQKMNQKTFTLNFTNYESSYKENEKLKAPKPQLGGSSLIMIGGDDSNAVYYKNLKENNYLHKTDIQGKTFLIVDAIKNLDWEVTSETKNIGNYTCYKATFSREAERMDVKMINNEVKETKEKYTQTTTAWFTPQIPVSNGPKNYGGLPGLILEINDGMTTIICSEIVLNPKEAVAVIKPKKGKKVDQEKFNKIQKEKAKEMMEQMKSRNGMEMGNGINIKFGG